MQKKLQIDAQTKDIYEGTTYTKTEMEEYFKVLNKYNRMSLDEINEKNEKKQVEEQENTSQKL